MQTHKMEPVTLIILGYLSPSPEVAAVYAYRTENLSLSVYKRPSGYVSRLSAKCPGSTTSPGAAFGYNTETCPDKVLTGALFRAVQAVKAHPGLSVEAEALEKAWSDHLPF